MTFTLCELYVLEYPASGRTDADGRLRAVTEGKTEREQQAAMSTERSSQEEEEEDVYSEIYLTRPVKSVALPDSWVEEMMI